MSYAQYMSHTRTEELERRLAVLDARIQEWKDNVETRMYVPHSMIDEKEILVCEIGRRADVEVFDYTATEERVVAACIDVDEVRRAVYAGLELITGTETGRFRS